MVHFSQSPGLCNTETESPGCTLAGTLHRHRYMYFYSSEPVKKVIQAYKLPLLQTNVATAAIMLPNSLSQNAVNRPTNNIVLSSYGIKTVISIASAISFKIKINMASSRLRKSHRKKMRGSLWSLSYWLMHFEIQCIIWHLSWVWGWGEQKARPAWWDKAGSSLKFGVFWHEKKLTIYIHFSTVESDVKIYDDYYEIYYLVVLYCSPTS